MLITFEVTPSWCEWILPENATSWIAINEQALKRALAALAARSAKEAPREERR